MDETIKIITDNLSLRLERVENQNLKQSDDINSIKMDIQKLNSKFDNTESRFDNIEEKVDTLDDKINDISLDLKDFKLEWKKGLEKIDNEKTAMLQSKLAAAEEELKNIKNNSFWNKIKNGLTEKGINAIVLIILIMLVFGAVMAYKNGIGLL